MRKLLFACLLTVLFSCVQAQTNTYTAFIYTDSTLMDEINSKYKELSKRRTLGEDLGIAALNAAKGIATGYVTSFFDLGIKVVSDFFTREQRKKQEWNEIVNSENQFETYISSISDLCDFYSTTSTAGALDSRGMSFNGFGCLRMEGKDTAFYISCHLDHSMIDRIVRHGKFQLVLDTLIISPFHSNLPNSSFDTAFSYKDRCNFSMMIQMDVTSSWMDQLVQIRQDQELGSFSIYIPVEQSDLDSTGFLRYVRKNDEEPRYLVMGESFIVPRSFTGMRDNVTGENIYGTGQYNLSIALRESCSLTESYRKNWKDNLKQRKKAAKNGRGLLSSAWQTITSQQWDELSQQWIITVLQAPVDVLKENAIEELHLNPTY